MDGDHVGHDDQLRDARSPCCTPGRPPSLGPSRSTSRGRIGLVRDRRRQPVRRARSMRRHPPTRRGSILNWKKLYTAEAIAVNSSGTDLWDTRPRRIRRGSSSRTSASTTPTLNLSGTTSIPALTKSSIMPSSQSPRRAMRSWGCRRAPRRSIRTRRLCRCRRHVHVQAHRRLIRRPSTPGPNYNVDLGDWRPDVPLGRFSHTSVDPCDGQTVWTIQEYVDGTDSWGVKKVGKILVLLR